MSKPLILITNDDGYQARGIAALVKAVAHLGEVWMVAPRENQSAVSFSVTIHTPIRSQKVSFPHTENAHWVSGSPADCVKFAVGNLLPRKPDLILSGINHGPNIAVNLLHSGTVAGAMEGCVDGVPAVAFSLDDWGPEFDFSGSAWAAEKVARQVLSNGLPDGVMLNVNVPKAPVTALKGFTICRQARSKWNETFKERLDPAGKPYYWLEGHHVNLDQGEDHDIAVIAEGYIAVTPIQLDRTDYQFAQAMKNWDF